MNKIVRRGTAVMALATFGMAVSACGAQAPTTQAEVCNSFDDLGGQLMQGNGFGNPLFDEAGHLASVADRYEGGGLGHDAKRLRNIAASDQTSGVELSNATDRIADLCGYPLAVSALGHG